METDGMSYAEMYGPGGKPVPWDRAADEPPCEARYNGRFWSPKPCRMALDHPGYHADLYGRTWGSLDPERYLPAGAVPEPEPEGGG